MNKKILINLLNNIKALEDSMKFIYRANDSNDMFPFSNFKIFMRKYNEIAMRVAQELNEIVVFDIYDLEKVKDWADTVKPQQKMYFDMVLANVALLRSTIENKLRGMSPVPTRSHDRLSAAT